MICTLQSNEIADHWHEIEPLLFEHPEWTPDDVRRELESARAQLWCLRSNGIRGIVVTQVQAPKGFIWIASGKGLDSEALTMLRVIEAWMKERGVRDLKIEGRRGWGRVLSGYEERATVFVKRL